MADNFKFNEGQDKTGAADDVSGVLYPRNKISFGTDGNASDVTTSSPFPVEINDNNNSLVSDVGTIAGAVSGSEMQVDVVAALPTGSNTIGSVKLTDGTETAAINGNSHIEMDIAEATGVTLDTSNVTIGSALPAGNNNVGSVDVDSLPNVTIGDVSTGGTQSNSLDVDIAAQSSGALDVSGATVDVDITAASGVTLDTSNVTIGASLPSGSNNIGTVDLGSGSVGLTDAATDGSSLGNGLLIQGDDGTDRKNVAVDSSTGNVQADVQNTVTVSGTVTADAGSGTYTVGQGTAGNLRAEVDINTSNNTVKVTDGTETAGVSASANLNVNLAEASGVTVDTSNVTIGSALPAGNNNIGNVDIASIPNVTIGDVSTGGTQSNNLGVDIANQSTGALDVSGATVTVTDDGAFAVNSQPARDRTSDNVGVAQQTDAVMNDTTALTPKFATIDVASSGDNTIVSGSAGKKIRVLQYALVCGSATVVQWQDTGGANLTGDMSFAANGGISAPYCPLGLFETTDGDGLDLNLGSANSVSGHLVYVEV